MVLIGMLKVLKLILCRYAFCSYVPMFGETDYDPTRQFCSISIEEQVDALGRAVHAGKVSVVAWLMPLWLPF